MFYKVSHLTALAFFSRRRLMMLFVIGAAVMFSLVGCGLSEKDKERRTKAVLAKHKDDLAECDRLQSQSWEATKNMFSELNRGDLDKGLTQFNKFL
jgi:hypothetical protein